MLDSALSYAGRGWAIMPMHNVQNGRCTCGRDDCEHPGNHPRISAWQEAATTDPAIIRAWWVTWPSANVGIHLGKSGLICADIDRHDADGFKSLGELLDRIKFDTGTIAEFTPGNGEHRFYKGVALPKTKYTLAPGVEILSGNHAVTVCPSKRGDRVYRWVDTAGPDEIDPLPFPQVLIDLLIVPKSVEPITTPAKPLPNGSTSHYARAALIAERDKVAFALKGERNDTLNKSSFALGQLVGAGVLDRGEVEAELLHAALLAGLPEGEARTTIKSGLDKGMAEPRDISPSRYTEPPCQNQKATLPITLLSADTILTTEWPEPVWAIPNLLPCGLTILAGRPKVGKSWLALQIAQAVAAGGVALGEKVQRGPVLYLALEDPARRLQERMKKQGWPLGLPADFMPLGQFQDQVGDLRNGGGEKLARQIETRGYRLVVIDTLSRSIGGDQNDTQDMTRGLTPLQEIAHTHNCAVILVDHHRKGNGFDADVIGDILGSTAKGAMVDTALGLYRERGKAGAKLAVIGREIEEQTLALTMDWLTGVWQVEGNADVIELNKRRQEILGVLSDMGAIGVTQIAKAVDRDKGNVYRDLQDMANAGLVKKSGKPPKVRYETLYTHPI